MPTITDIVLNKLDEMILESQQFSEESKRTIAELREVLLANDWILPFDRLPVESLEKRTMICIDGANTTTPYQVGDLIVVGASVGQSYYGLRPYTEDNIPSEAYVDLIAHSHDNARLVSAMRGLQELRLLAELKDTADVRIIDGGYLTNTLELLDTLTKDNKSTVEVLLSQNFYDYDEKLQNALQELLHPNREQMGKIIAVVKSDSNKVYSKLFQDRWGIDVSNLSDRMIADRVLLPGEFLTPRWLDSNSQLIDVLKKRVQQESYFKGISNKNLLDKLVRDSIEPLQMLRSQKYDPTLEGVLWSSYFKPAAWHEFSKSIRIEYPFYQSNPRGINYRDFCREMVQIVDSDIIDSDILEPIAQWEADRVAKKVSEATKLAQLKLESGMDNDMLLRMRSYRTT